VRKIWKSWEIQVNRERFQRDIDLNEWVWGMVMGSVFIQSSPHVFEFSLMERIKSMG
jgi:hypothetical protein